MLKPYYVLGFLKAKGELLQAGQAYEPEKNSTFFVKQNRVFKEDDVKAFLKKLREEIGDRSNSVWRWLDEME